ncbi:MAG: 1-(5-phosphoribosyl)-5-[Candidatus Methanomethylophilus sp.]|jgi:phosphoribosylformimino-5-aminoimidazole carboxamide ribotide isomerase|nr:phosphoribosylformimino-5- aminoimidazole carboxamide ribotide isomerase HisA [methanogenic archaeon ISO4-H5]MBQ5397496.1 1-(5-phosphoribosyl)-5-[(5-phosphoribosylamino)methylideneamino]imidazole-4-carboxamide isomerase [Methanomethylophilus sp.]MBQ5447350.1 1-(5-phosphoribosyl)-5-[(5-phosphoribosylamino)methylideneamino]imidazole-4-carboxamide isomerase [Methanomethylophilus sp.]
MIVIPAVDVLDHKVVQLVGGMPGSQQVVLEDPFEVAMDWVAKGAPYLHLVDLDAAFGKEDNSDVFCRIIREAGVPVEVGGGIRTEEQIAKYVKAGAERIVVGTKAVTDTEWLKEMANKFPNKLMLGLDMKDGKIAIKGWQESAPIALEQMFRILETVPVVAVLHTDINVEGQQGGINRERVDRFCKDCPVTVIISGGVTTEEDAKAAAKSGAGGVVVGMALYKGTMKPWTFGRPWVAE